MGGNELTGPAAALQGGAVPGLCVLRWGAVPSARSTATAKELLTFMHFTSKIQAAVLTCSHLWEKQPSA